MMVDIRTDADYRKICYAYLNGERVTRCIAADEEAGYVVRYVTDEQGYVVVDESREPKTEKLTGVVRIEDTGRLRPLS